MKARWHRRRRSPRGDLPGDGGSVLMPIQKAPLRVFRTVHLHKADSFSSYSHPRHFSIAPPFPPVTARYLAGLCFLFHSLSGGTSAFFSLPLLFLLSITIQHTRLPCHSSLYFVNPLLEYLVRTLNLILLVTILSPRGFPRTYAIFSLESYSTSLLFLVIGRAYSLSRLSVDFPEVYSFLLFFFCIA